VASFGTPVPSSRTSLYALRFRSLKSSLLPLFFNHFSRTFVETNYFPKEYSKAFIKKRKKRFFMVSLLMSLLLRQAPGFAYGLHIKRTGHNPPRVPSADWWMLTTANTAGSNGLTCLLKHGKARDNKFLVTHPMTDQRCLTSTIARRIAQTAGPSSSSLLLFNPSS
jgi:hypothetical protein